VFNGNTDGFNNNAQGYIWQQMGLLDANGRPATRQGNNLVDSGGNVVGSVILSGTTVIGYRNAAGTMECYDVSAGATTAQAWGRVANNGELHIIKHGASYEEPPGTPHEGGGIQLDGGEVRDGFAPQPPGGTGTGVGYGDADGPNGAYPLTPRPGAKITVNVNSCWSAKDPDDGGPQRSVTDSAGDVPGVGATEGHQGRVQTRLHLELTGGTPAQRQAAWKALIAAARAAGFRNPDGHTGRNEVALWLSSLSFLSQYSTAQKIIDKAVPPPGTVKPKISYSKKEEKPKKGIAANGVVEDGYSVMPLHLRPSPPPFATQYYYGNTWPCSNPWCIWTARLDVPPSVGPPTLVSPTIFHINQVGVPPAPLPANQVVNSGMMDFYTVWAAPPSFSPSLSITLDYYDTSGPLAVYRHDGVAPGWQQVPTKSQDVTQTIVTVEAPTLSVYVVLMGVNPGLEFGPPTATGGACPGSSVLYTLAVTNTGDYTDTIDLAASGVWTPTLSTLAVPLLGPKQSEKVTLTVSIPPTAVLGSSDTALVTATSTISPALSRTSQVTTEARGAAGLQIAPAAQTGSGSPGDSVTYALTVTNSGSCGDRVVLAAGGLWTPTLSSPVIPALGAGLAEMLTLTVDIPPSATGGMSDTAAVTATSTISPALSREAQVTTTTPYHKVYLPIVVKSWGP
jgi:hypothetical protein